ncbi:hypothetical protein BofuT4_P158510.1 [Botrytis cinerea T4]|uniref:Uncharacterized protein n=1 Tax=Botryotinia fuckeliana (strain T4) TaxID=999810 RepID=G2YV07_BOTF4|nr:hypothetical protein BofuT4_P158510.1 [Botrytis cinerea T4]
MSHKQKHISDIQYSKVNSIMSTILPSNSRVDKDYTKSLSPSNKSSRGKTEISHATFMEWVSKEGYNTRKMEQQRQGRWVMEMNQTQSAKFLDNPSGHKKNSMLNLTYDQTLNGTKESAVSKMKEKKKRSGNPRKSAAFENSYSHVSSTVAQFSQAKYEAARTRPQVTYQSRPQGMHHQEKNTKSANSPWIHNAGGTKRTDKQHQEKDSRLATAAKTKKDRYHLRIDDRYMKEKPQKDQFNTRKNPEPENYDLESGREDQRLYTSAYMPTPTRNENPATFEEIRDNATRAIEHSQIARAEATRVIMESQAVRARIEKALAQRLAEIPYKETSEGARLSGEMITETAVAPLASTPFEDVPETIKDVYVGSPQTSNTAINTMESNAKNTASETATKGSKIYGSMDNYRIEFIREDEDDAENAEDDWVEVMGNDEDDDEVEEDGWLLA